MSLNISSNSIGGYGKKEGWAALATALKSNTTLTELNIADNILVHPNNQDSVKTVADAISTNGALVKFTFSGDATGYSDDKKNSKPVTIESSITEADFSGRVLQLSLIHI